MNAEDLKFPEGSFDLVLRKTNLNLEKWKTDNGFAIPAEVVIVIARK